MATIATAWIIGRDLWNRTVGLVAALLLAGAGFTFTSAARARSPLLKRSLLSARWVLSALPGIPDDGAGG